MADWTITKLLAWTQSYFKEHDIDSPRLTAEILLSFSLGLERLDLYLQHDRPLEKQELAEFKSLIKRRVDREPVAYITGEKGFYDSRFEVDKGVLIPRPDTETIVEESLKLIEKVCDKKKENSVLELGTGSGAIIISLAKAKPGYSYTATDISDDAVYTAKKNAHNILGDKIEFITGSWFDPVEKNRRFDLVISNPPYIPTRDIDDLAPEIKSFEPVLALDGGADGLDCYRIIIEKAVNFLNPGGFLLLEIGFDQREGIMDIFNGHDGYENVEFVKDLAGHARVAKLKKSIDYE